MTSSCPNRDEEDRNRKVCKRLNAIEFETRFGLRSIELWNADLSAFTEPLDLLAVSAFSHDVRIVAGNPEHSHFGFNSLAAALARRSGINLGRLYSSRGWDFTEALGCWVSADTQHPLIKRIICLEDIGFRFVHTEAISNLFLTIRILEAKGEQISSMGLPVLGAGLARNNPTDIILPLVACAQECLSTSTSLQHVFFVEYDVNRAVLLSDAIDKELGRIHVAIPKSSAAEGVREEIVVTIDMLLRYAKPEIGRTLLDARRIVKDTQARSTELGLVARRVVELLVKDVGSPRCGFELFKQIDKLSEIGVSDWMRSYMHTLRILGNEAAHQRGSEGRMPATLQDSDLVIALFCLLRILEFWHTLFRKEQPLQTR